MFSVAGIDLLEQELLESEHTLLEILLQDKTTKKNIIWATDDYEGLGEEYRFRQEIRPELITGKQDTLICYCCIYYGSIFYGWKSVC